MEHFPLDRKSGSPSSAGAAARILGSHADSSSVIFTQRIFPQLLAGWPCDGSARCFALCMADRRPAGGVSEIAHKSRKKAGEAFATINTP
jgi:hypothetical protein